MYGKTSGTAPYETPNPSYPACLLHHAGTAPFGTQNPSYSAGAGPSRTAPYETPNPSSTAGF